jgi:hypothetical protein
MSTTISTPSPAGNAPVAKSFVTDTSSLKGLVNVDEIKTKVYDTIDTWGKANQEIQNKSKGWQTRNENVAKVNESLEGNKKMEGNVKVKVPTNKDGSEIKDWDKKTDSEKEDIWKQAVDGTGNYKLTEKTMSAENYMKKYEGMGNPNKDNNDTGKSANQTMINNIMTRNSNNYNQLTQKFQYEMSNLQTSISTLQQLLKEFFNMNQQGI